MKSQLLAIWCGLVTWAFMTVVFLFLLSEMRFEFYEALYGGVGSFVAGFLGVVVSLLIDKHPRVWLYAIAASIISLAWVLSFPCPEWRKPFLWHWPLWGMVSFMLLIGTVALNKSGKIDTISGASS